MDDLDVKIEFLAAEALRNVDGLVLDVNSERFASELGRRDFVRVEMWKGKSSFRLCFYKAASDEIIWHCKCSTRCGVMRFYESVEALAKDMGVPLCEEGTAETRSVASAWRKRTASTGLSRCGIGSCVVGWQGQDDGG